MGAHARCIRRLGRQAIQLAQGGVQGYAPNFEQSVSATAAFYFIAKPAAAIAVAGMTTFHRATAVPIAVAMAVAEQFSINVEDLPVEEDVRPLVKEAMKPRGRRFSFSLGELEGQVLSMATVVAMAMVVRAMAMVVASAMAVATAVAMTRPSATAMVSSFACRAACQKRGASELVRRDGSPSTPALQ